MPLCPKCKGEVRATHAYNQLKPMCERHYEEVVTIVGQICCPKQKMPVTGLAKVKRKK